jgi:prepilin-type N-terminal cleavage/methylation domain-containing protein
MRPRGSTCARRGFTLAELVVVLVLLGIMLAVVTPALLTSGTERDAATMLAGTLESARTTAIRTASPVDVVVDPTAARIWISTLGGAARVDTSFTLESAGASYAAITRRARFHFRADGTGWGDTLIVTSGGRAASVFVHSLAGTVEQRMSTAVVVAR